MATESDRGSLSLRPLSISQSVLKRADGSAQFSFGNVTVLSSVTGPAEVRLREEIVDRSTLEFNVSRLQAPAGPRLKSIENHLTTLFDKVILSHLYPRSLIQITSQTTSSPSTSYSTPFSTSISQSNVASSSPRKRIRTNKTTTTGASEVAATINSISLALIDAGIQLGGTLVAVSIAFLSTTTEEEEEELVLDPTVFQEEQAASTLVVTVRFGGSGSETGSVVGIESQGIFSPSQLFQAQEVAINATQTILGFMRRSIETKYGVEPSSSTPENSSREIKMCVAEEGREISPDDEDDDDAIMI
ncbi:exosome complex component RRP46 [Sporobolomyces koalae]|uniref:exosome complex component RRP46 n=1 Tax=Sporobolomyces koalae TaxID=500713 RepID=UPI0031705A90